MKLFLIIALATIVFFGCNSSPVGEPDYRDAFEGEYVGPRINSSWSLNGPYTSSESLDTIVVVSVGDSSLSLDGATEIIISPDGLFYEQGGASASSYFSVQFTAPDSLKTEMNGGGLGGGYHSSFKGRKM